MPRSGPGAAVLEIGCGTGQFTRQLDGRALNLTAIDIGAALVQADPDYCGYVPAARVHAWRGT
jgi:16S rRNA A1518/A1519 N6-dimethyltransferase RsmA/KsgA/DIM1 with predicted DNA glycosylase/AP lyase activity